MEGDYVHLGQFEVSGSYLRKDALQAVGFLSLQGRRKTCTVDTGLGTVGVWTSQECVRHDDGRVRSGRGGDGTLGNVYKYRNIRGKKLRSLFGELV